MSSISRIAKPRLLAFLCVGIMASLPAFAQAQVLEQVPSDAPLVFRVKNLQDVSDKAGVLIKQWGIDQMVPQAADPIGAWLTVMKFNAGINKSGDAAFVLYNLDFEAHAPQMLVLLPVSDYKAFIGNFPDAKKDGDLDVVRMEINGQKEAEDTFVANWGKYAALTPSKDLLAKKPDGLKVAGATGKELETKDLCYYANFKAISPKLLDPLKQNEERILGEIDKELAGNPQFNQKFTPVIKVLVKQTLAAAKGFLTDTQAITFGVNLTPEGISTSLVTEFADGSYAGKMFAGLKNTDAPLLAGLPDAKYLFLGGSVGGGDGGIKMVNDFLDPVMKELAATGEDGKAILNYTQAVQTMLASTKASTFGLIAPTGALGQSALLQMIAIYQGDSAAILGAQKKAVDSEQEVMAMFQRLGGAAAPKADIKYTPNAKEVDGVKFDQFTTTFDLNDNSVQGAQMKTMMAMMYGPNGASGYSATLDAQHLLIVSGLDDATISAAIKAVKANQDVLSDAAGMAVTNKALPKSRLGVFYFSVDNTVNTVTNYAKMMGMPIPVTFKPNLPPLGMAVSTEGSAVRADGFIPSDVVQEIMATAIKYQMLQGHKPGQPGGI